MNFKNIYYLFYCFIVLLLSIMNNEKNYKYQVYIM